MACEANESSQVERVFCYRARPPIAEQRLRVSGECSVVYALNRPFSDGTIHELFEPIDFVACLVALLRSS